MSTLQIPSAEQLRNARLARWHQASSPAEGVLETADAAHQNGAGADPLLTQDALRTFVQSAGLVLFQRTPQLTAPAPTIVEAILGRSEATPSHIAGATPREMLARLLAEGSAAALNLLASPQTTADSPDFVVSAAVFPYVFTLRGDKLWKQPPSNSGPAKVSPLAINTFVLLTEGGPRSAGDLATELGKGLTEAAVLRALSELWQQLRVLPVAQEDGSPALWEPAAARFTKQIKAGGNAGQPTALSALASLYLGQSLLATEDEVETFLSPLASRSRIRGVLHDLLAAQQLEAVAIEGKQHLYLAGEMPEFGADTTRTTQPAAGETQPVELTGDGSRIRTFQPRKIGTGFIARAKPFAAGEAGKQERVRRPFTKGAPRSAPGANARGRTGTGGERGARGAKLSFARPWEEDRSKRPAAPGARAGERSEADAGPPAGRRGDQPRGATGFAGRGPAGSRPAYSRRPPQDGRPAFSGERDGAGSKRAWGPPRERKAAPGGERTPFRARPRPADRDAGDGGGRDLRRSAPGPRTYDRGAGDRPKTGAPRRFPAAPRGVDRAGEGQGASAGDRPRFRRFDEPRPGSKRPFIPRAPGAAPPGRPSGPSQARAGGGSKPWVSRGIGASAGARSERAGAPRSRPSGEFRSAPPRGAGGGPARPGGRAKSVSPGGAAAKGAGPFEKFKGVKKPWGKRPPPRKIKPIGDEGGA